MKMETHLESVMLSYGIKLIEIFLRNPNQEVIEYLLHLVTNKQRIAIHSALTKEVQLRSTSLPKDVRSKLEKNLKSAYEDELLMGDLDDYAKALIGKVFSVRSGFHTYFTRKTLSILRQRLRELKEKSTVDPKQVPLRERIEHLSQVFGLNKKEAEIVTFFYVKEINDKAGEVFRIDDLKMDTVRKSVKNYCRFFGLLPHELRDILKSDAPLVRSGILERNRHDDDIELSSHIISFLSGLTTSDLTGQFFEKTPIDGNLELKDFLIPDQNIEIMADLLNSKHGTNILLYGAPGTGKTEFAKALAKATGLDAVFVKQTDEDGDEDLSHRKTAMVAAQNVLRGNRCILIVDECDPIINTAGGLFSCDNGEKNDEKSWINHYTERSVLKVVWISNRVNGVDPSTKRRFSYAQEFRNPGVKQRMKAWHIQKSVHGVDFLDHKAIEHMARAYSVSPGTINLALRDVMATQPKAGPQIQMAMLKNILEQQQAFCLGKKSALTPINQNYSLSGLNMDTPPERVINSIRMFLERSSDIQMRNLNVLLVGPPGTGKTEFVKHIAEESDRELLVKRTSDIISPYVGQSEQNIAQVFMDAEQSGAILFLDEADSLFINREAASRSWEISQTNELLCQMENFSGILVCATNFHKSMDLAVMRRFTHKICFDYLEPEGNELFFERVLGNLLDKALHNEQRTRVRGLKHLAPGDFKVVYQKFAFEAPVPADELINALEEEASFGYRRGPSPIGLAGQVR